MAEGVKSANGLKNIVVAVKQVPDTTQVKVDPETGTLVREGIPFIINPFDTHAVETALQLKDRYGGRVIAITMGPPNAKETLRRCLALGVDDVILVSDRAFGGADTLATSLVLAETIRKISETFGPVDLVICGKQTIDGDTAQVGPGVAKRLDMQLLTYVSKIVSVKAEASEIVVERRAEGGVQLLKTSLPCLVTVLEGGNQMRFANMPNMFRAARHPLKMWDKDAAGIENIARIGLKGSPTVVSKVFAPTPKSERAEMIEVESGDPKDMAVTVLSKMFTRFPAVEKEIARRA